MANGDPIRIGQVSEYMGHAGIAITADRYAHLLAGARDQAGRQGRRLPG